MRKLLGKAAPDSAQGDLSSIPGTTTPIQTPYRPSKSQNAVYPAGAPISCFDVAPDRRAAVLAGPHVLKSVVLDDSAASSFSFVEGVDVRAAIATRQTIGPRTNVVADQLNIRDVKWHGTSTIYTACGSGKVFAYDLARIGAGGSEPLDYILMQEDSRQINSLDVNPHLKSWLLSGGQDGTARVFDTSNPVPSRVGISFRQRFAPLRCIDPIRQVQWSPKMGHEVACCTESGVVMKWDVRQPSRPVLRINAHEKTCSAIAWHPDGVHLISAGGDTKIHVWDLGNTADKRQKPKWTISAPAPVAAVAWRPGLWSASAQARRVAQVAVAYDETSSRRYGTSAVQIWDWGRPSMPYKEIERFETSPSALAWQDQDMLWTVGQDGSFNQCDVAFAPKVLERQSTSAMAFSPRSDVMMFLDERPQSHRPRPTVASHPDILHRATFGANTGNQGLSVSRSDSDDDVLGSFLGPRRRVTRKRRLSGRGGVALSTTPPSGGAAFPDDPKQNLGLEQSINVTGIFKTQQAMSSGRIPVAKPVQVYHFLSNAYLETLQRELPCKEGGKPMAERIGIILEQYARAAEVTNMYRLAQTWRILAYAMALLLKRRAQYHFELRVGQFQKMQVEDGGKGGLLKPADIYANGGEDTPRRPGAQRSSIDGRFHTIRSLLAEEIESTSNVPTPVARPVDSDDGPNSHSLTDRLHQHGKKLEPIVEPESLSLGPAAHGSFSRNDSNAVNTGSPGSRQRQDSGLMSEDSLRTDDSQVSYTDGYDFYDAEALAKAIDVPFPSRQNGSRAYPYRGRPVRHDSEESGFSQMFSISNGTRRSTVRSNSSGDAFARPGLARHESDASKESGMSSHDSPVMPKTLSNRDRQTPSSGDSTEEVFQISQTTMKSTDSYPSQPSHSSQSDVDPADTGASKNHASVPGVETGGRSVSPKKRLTSPRHDPRPYVIEADFLPWHNDPPYPHPLSASWTGNKTMSNSPSPLDPCHLLLRALDFESRTSALNASAMILLLKPLVPESVIDSHRASAILRQQHSRLMGMGLFVEATLLRNLCVQGWPEGLPEWGDNYVAIFGAAQQGVKVGLFCLSCRKPREVDPSGGAEAVWTCERCRHVMAPCAVCGHREAEIPSHIPPEITPGPQDLESEAWLSQWWYCPGCAHGGHASCLQLWHGASEQVLLADASAKFSDGCCPADGCGHACLPGKYRGEMTTARSDELGRAAVDSSRARDEARKPGSRGGSRRSSPGATGDRSVRSDVNDVPQSKAVGMAREALNKGGAGPSSGGILSSSPGRMGTPSAGDRERRKSVKFARTDRG